MIRLRKQHPDLRTPSAPSSRPHPLPSLAPNLELSVRFPGPIESASTLYCVSVASLLCLTSLSPRRALEQATSIFFYLFSFLFLFLVTDWVDRYGTFFRELKNVIRDGSLTAAGAEWDGAERAGGKPVSWVHDLDHRKKTVIVQGTPAVGSSAKDLLQHLRASHGQPEATKRQAEAEGKNKLAWNF